MPEKTYSCGTHLKFTKADYGKTFHCEKCHQIHSYPPHPDKSKRKKAKRTQKTTTLPKLNGRNKLWLYLLTLSSRLFSFFSRSKKPKKNKRSSATTIDIPIKYTISHPIPPVPIPTHLQNMKVELIRKTWRKEVGPSKIQLSQSQLSPPNWDACIQIMLKHVEKVAPQISIPFQIPRLVFKLQSKDSGGTFELDEEGYVSITIDTVLQNNHYAALAVLAHELCHYILGSNGIKRIDKLANEELTDIAMFVFGFGEIFLKGHRAQPNKTYGYLKLGQYQALQRSISETWSNRKSSTLINNKEEALEKWVVSVVYRGDKDHYANNYDFMRKKHPNLSKYDILDKIKYDYRR